MTDIYQSVTATIINAIAASPDKFQMPWHRGGASGVPTNATTGHDYQGVNIVTLWVLGMPYAHPVWATYRQWLEIGCQVRKGEKASPIIYYSTYEKEDGDETKRVPFIKQSSVFNAEQVDGWTPPVRAEMPPLERLAAIDGFVTGTAAKVLEGGAKAYYSPTDDLIRMPDGERFFDTSTSSRTETFYSTLMHELTHWSGAKHRLARDMSGRFGNEAYAAEELIAELGAAFLCARLQITPTVREDHSQYIANWLQVFKNDSKAIFTAAAQAQLATDYLIGLSKEHDDVAERAA